MKTMSRGLAALGMLIGCAALVVPVPAEAKIRCNGQYQIIKGVGQLSTPYCEDNYLAKVAALYGSRVSAKAIRNNPNKKQEVCQFVGHDTRVSSICSQYNDFGGQNRHR